MCKYLLLGMIAYLAPIKAEIYLVFGLVFFDWTTGVAKGIKTYTFTSAQAIRKFWVLLGYTIGLLSLRSLEMYFCENFGEMQLLKDGLFCRLAVAGITMTELKSLQENVKVLTGVDLFGDTIKVVPKIFKKK